MSDRLLTVLEPLREALLPTLVGPDGYARLVAVAASLPAELTSFWGLECRLSQAAPLADILLEIRASGRGQRLLSGVQPSALDGLCERWPVWRRLRTLAQRWSDPDDPVGACFRNLWLEFDTASAATPEQIDATIGHPCIFLGPRADTRAALPDLLPEILGLLAAPALPASVLRDFIATLPADLCPFQVGMMLARPDPGVRICVNRLPVATIPEWLAGSGWPGSISALTEQLQPLARLVERLAVGLTLTATGVDPRVGIECYLPDDRLSEYADQWIPVLDLIADLGLCLPEKRRGLLAFPGVTATPVGARRSRDGLIYTNLFRRIHHIKLSILDDRIIEAKAYLALNRAGLHLDRVATDHDTWSFE
jgi:hypothetical protein